MKWTTHDAIKWFKFALASNDSIDNDYVIENLSDDDSDNEGDVDNQHDEKQQQQHNVIVKEKKQQLDYNIIEQQLRRIKFRSKRHLLLIQNQFHLHSYGFDNKCDRKILCNAIKQLIHKYPKTQDNNSNSKQKRNENQENNDIEGFVEATQHH